MDENKLFTTLVKINLCMMEIHETIGEVAKKTIAELKEKDMFSEAPEIKIAYFDY